MFTWSMAGDDVATVDGRAVLPLPCGEPALGACYCAVHGDGGTCPPRLREFAACLARSLCHLRKHELEEHYAALTTELRAVSTGSSGFHWEVPAGA